MCLYTSGGCSSKRQGAHPFSPHVLLLLLSTVVLCMLPETAGEALYYEVGYRKLQQGDQRIAESKTCRRTLQV